MTIIAEIRQKLNDSTVGQKINGSIPGIMVEGASRAISDETNKTVALGIAAAGCAVKRPLQGFIAGAAYGIAKSLPPSAEDHYSLTSPLWEKVGKGESAYMQRVPVRDAIVARLWKKSPEQVLAFAMYTAEPTVYR